MSTPFFQPLDPAAAPPPVTPHDGPGDEAGYASVAPAGIVGAPYDINAPQDIAGITAALSAAMDLTGGQEGAGTGAGIPDRSSPRQQATAAILDSPQGAGAMSVIAGFPDYEQADITPPDLVPPLVGGPYPGTMQDGVTTFMHGANAGVEGVIFPEGDMGGGAGLGYPGTTQDGLTKYGTT